MLVLHHYFHRHRYFRDCNSLTVVEMLVRLLHLHHYHKFLVDIDCMLAPHHCFHLHRFRIRSILILGYMLFPPHRHNHYLLLLHLPVPHHYIRLHQFRFYNNLSFHYHHHLDILILLLLETHNP